MKSNHFTRERFVLSMILNFILKLIILFGIIIKMSPSRLSKINYSKLHLCSHVYLYYSKENIYSKLDNLKLILKENNLLKIFEQKINEFNNYVCQNLKNINFI
jgi:hypothetical protein